MSNSSQSLEQGGGLDGPQLKEKQVESLGEAELNYKVVSFREKDKFGLRA